MVAASEGLVKNVLRFQEKREVEWAPRPPRKSLFGVLGICSGIVFLGEKMLFEVETRQEFNAKMGLAVHRYGLDLVTEASPFILRHTESLVRDIQAIRSVTQTYRSVDTAGYRFEYNHCSRGAHTVYVVTQLDARLGPFRSFVEVFRLLQQHADEYGVVSPDGAAALLRQIASLDLEVGGL